MAESESIVVKVRVRAIGDDQATMDLLRLYLDACTRTNALNADTPRTAIEQAKGCELEAARALIAALMHPAPPAPRRIWIPVESSNVAGIGHDDPRMDLYVSFRNGAVYAYHGVPFAVVRAFLDAPSKGGYLNQHIKGGYAYTKLEQPAEEAV